VGGLDRPGGRLPPGRDGCRPSARVPATTVSQ